MRVLTPQRFPEHTFGSLQMPEKASDRVAGAHCNKPLANLGRVSVNECSRALTTSATNPEVSDEAVALGRQKTWEPEPKKWQ